MVNCLLLLLFKCYSCDSIQNKRRKNSKLSEELILHFCVSLAACYWSLVQHPQRLKRLYLKSHSISSNSFLIKQVNHCEFFFFLLPNLPHQSLVGKSAARRSYDSRPSNSIFRSSKGRGGSWFLCLTIKHLYIELLRGGRQIGNGATFITRSNLLLRPKLRFFWEGVEGESHGMT